MMNNEHSSVYLLVKINVYHIGDRFSARRKLPVKSTCFHHVANKNAKCYMLCFIKTRD